MRHRGNRDVGERPSTSEIAHQWRLLNPLISSFCLFSPQNPNLCDGDPLQHDARGQRGCDQDLRWDVMRGGSAILAAKEESREPLVSTWNLFRLALVSACMLFAVLVSTVYSLHRASGAAAPTARGGWLETKQSPLHHILLRDQTLADELKHTDCGLLERINEKATLELKSLVITETVVPYQDRAVLAKYVKEQLDASSVISAQQKAAVMTLVDMAPVEGSINKEERGEAGSLRNSAVIALFKTHQNNIHFMLIGVRVEPRLGMWRRISSKERNEWNDVLSRVLYNKVRGEAKTFLAYGTPTRLLVPSAASDYDASRLFSNGFE